MPCAKGPEAADITEKDGLLTALDGTLLLGELGTKVNWETKPRVSVATRLGICAAVDNFSGEYGSIEGETRFGMDSFGYFGEHTGFETLVSV